MGAYNDEVLFIHIPKTAGQSVKEWMEANLPDVKWPRPKEYFGGDEEQSRKTIEESGLPIGHIPLRDIERFTGRAPDTWQKIIGVVRNPYEQQVSQWSFWRDRYARGQRHVHDICAAQYPSIHGWLEDPGCDFHLWYEQRFASDQPIVKKYPGPDTDYANFGGYYLYWLAVDDAIPPNVEILRSEDLNVTLPASLGVDADLGRINTSPHHANFAEYFSHPNPAKVHRALERIEQKFKWTFESNLYQKLVADGEPGS